MKKLTACLLICAMAFLYGACGEAGPGEAGGGGAGGSTSKGTIKVGAVLSLTGQYDQYGLSIERGINLAVKKINAEGGINKKDFNVTIVDSKSTVEGARAAFNQLKSQGVKIIIGPETTDLTEALIPLAMRNSIYMISPSASSPSLAAMDSGGYFYRICPSDTSEAMQIAAEIQRANSVYPFIKRSQNRALVLVRNDNSYTKGLWRAFGGELGRRELEYEILYFMPDHMQNGSEELQTILEKAESYRRYHENPEKMGVIVIFGYADDVQFLLRKFDEKFYDDSVNSEYREEKINLELYASSAVDTSEFIIGAATVSPGLVFPRMFDPKVEDVAIVDDFVLAYNQTHQETPDLYAAYGYDSALLIGLTLKRDGISEAIAEPLNFRLNMNDVGFSGVTGSVDFQQSTGEVAKTPNLYKMIENGEAIPIGVYEQARIRKAIEARDRLRGGRNN